jgi:LmbE family N-acetylglucosaminyl deacetylase
VLAVVAHPDDESFGLGALLTAYAAAGSCVGVLCFTHGEASTLHGVQGDLRTVRTAELQEAARVLGVTTVELGDHVDGRLSEVPVPVLAAGVAALARRIGAEGLLVFDSNGVTSHPDHVQATRAATEAAAGLGIPVLAWALPDDVADLLNEELATTFRGRPSHAIDARVRVDRGRQLAAVHAHPSQAVPGAPLWRRLELLGDHEHVRWLVPPPAGDALT